MGKRAIPGRSCYRYLCPPGGRATGQDGLKKEYANLYAEMPSETSEGLRCVGAERRRGSITEPWEGVVTQVPDSLPPDDKREEWIAQHAKALQQALGNPEIRARIASLLVDDDARRQRRLAELAKELDGTELTIRLGSEDGKA